MKGWNWRKIWPYLLIAGLLVFYVMRYKRAPNLEFDEMTITQPDGSRVGLTELFEGKTVVHFYASWCGPCMREMAEINQHFEEIKQNNINILFLTDDPEDRIDAIRSKMPSDVSFYQIPSLQDAGIYTIPTSYFILDTKTKSKQIEPVDWTNMNEINKKFTE